MKAQMHVGPVRMTDGHVDTIAGFEPPSTQWNLNGGGNRTAGASIKNRTLVPSIGIPGHHVAVGDRTQPSFEVSQISLSRRPGRWDAALPESVGSMTLEVKANKSGDAKRSTKVLGVGEPPDYNFCQRPPESQLMVSHIMRPSASFQTTTAPAHVGCLRATEGFVDAVARYETPSAQSDLGSGDVGACMSVDGTAQKGKLSLGAGVGGLQICRTAAKGDVKSKVKLASSNKDTKRSTEEDTKRSTEVSSGGDNPPGYDSCLRPSGSQLMMPYITGHNTSLSTYPTAQMYVGPIRVTERHVNTVACFETPSSQCDLGSRCNRTVGASNHNCALVPSIGIPGHCVDVEGRTRSCIEAGQSRLWPPPGRSYTALQRSVGAMTPEVKAKESDVGACLSVEERAHTGSFSLGAGAGGLLIRGAAAKSDMNRKEKLEPSRTSTTKSTEISSGGDDPPGYDSCLRPPGSQLTMPHNTGPNASFSTYPTAQMYVGPIRVTERHVNTVACFETPSSQCDLGSRCNRTVSASTYNCVLVPSIGIPGPCVDVEGRTRLCVEAGQSRLWQHTGRWDSALQGSVGVMTPEVKSKEPDIGACLSVEASVQTGSLSLGAGAGGPQIQRAATKSDVKCKVKLASSGSASQTGAQVHEVRGHRSFASTGRLPTPASGLIFPGAKTGSLRL